MDLLSNTVRLRPKSNNKRIIPDHLIKPAVEIRATIAPPVQSKFIRNESGRPLTIKEKKALAEEQNRIQAEAKKNAKAQRSLTLLMMSFKHKLLDNKMDDESISDTMLAITVSQAK